MPPTKKEFRREKVKVSEIRRLAGLMCTTREAAAFLGIRERTFLDMLKYDEAAKAAWEQGGATGKVSLRRKQFRLADSSAPMAIFLGKQYLGQHDITVTEHSGRDGGPIESADYDLTKLDQKGRKDLRAILMATRKPK